MSAYAAFLIEEGHTNIRMELDRQAPRFSSHAEDERFAREELAKFLETQGLRVRQAQSGREAVDLANITGAGVVLMDVGMEGSIDAAWEIQSTHPLFSIIFITTYARDSRYHQRVKDVGLRVAGWIEKPIVRQLHLLIRLIEKEARKVEVRRSLERARDRGLAPDDFVRSIALWDTELPQDVTDEVLEELNLPGTGSRSEESGRASAEITKLYAEIRSLLPRSASEPNLKSEIDPLMARLRMLQKQEAERMEQRFRNRLSVQPERVRELLARAERLVQE
jgi:CheY-like chemotaxis protein